MARRLALALPAPETREDWIKHFIDHHTRSVKAPSPDDLRKYLGVFMNELNDHNKLHALFHTGHEHQGNLIVPARLK